MSKMSEQVFNLKLVAEVEKHPCLYNYNLPEYSRKDITEEAWFEIGKKVNLTGHECKERWKNLRAVFVRHLRPSASNKTLKPYYLSEAMQFTLPFIKTKQYHKVSASDVQKIEIESDQEENSFTSLNMTPSPCSSPVSQPEAPSPQPSHSSWSKDNKNSFGSDALVKYGHTDIQEINRMFVLSLMPDLNAMTPSQLRTFKKRVMEIIIEILEDNRYK